jgi:hypothetical protein
MASSETTPRDAIGSMSGIKRMPADTWTFKGIDGRSFRVEDYGSGRVWVQDLGHPTGMGWWVQREELERRNACR